jgi:hypothetical protein
MRLYGDDAYEWVRDPTTGQRIVVPSAQELGRRDAFVNAGMGEYAEMSEHIWMEGAVERMKRGRE